MVGLLVPNAKQQFTDQNGVPLDGGRVYFYEVGTTTPKDTFSDQDLGTANQNPIPLDAGGWNPDGGIWGPQGASWRQIVYDRLGNTIWDKVTSTPSSAGTATVYDLVIWAEGVLEDGEEFLVYNVVRTETLPVDLLGSVFSILVAPTGDLEVVIKHNGVPAGTVTFHTDLSYTVSWLALVTLLAGDQLTFFGPATADAAGAGIAGTLVKTVV